MFSTDRLTADRERMTRETKVLLSYERICLKVIVQLYKKSEFEYVRKNILLFLIDFENKTLISYS